MSKKRLIMFATVLIGALLQQLLPGWAVFGGLKPPILAALALHYALRQNRREMWISVFTAALVQDGLEIGPFGPALIAFPLFGWAANRIHTEIFSDGFVTQLIFGALLGVFTVLVTMILYALTGQRPLTLGQVFLRLSGGFWLGLFTLPAASFAAKKFASLFPERRGYGWQ